MAKVRGMGSIFRRKVRMPDGSQREVPTWSIQYCINGRVYRESAHSENYTDAQKMLKRRIAEQHNGVFAGPAVDRVTVGDLLDGLLTEYRIKEKSIARFADPIVSLHLRPFFGTLKASKLTSGWLTKYIDSRQAAGAANATINRELSLLRRALNIGKHSTPPKVTTYPRFEMLPENTPRKGFFEHEEYLAMKAALPPDTAAVLVFGYYTGCRLGEILGLRWEQVDFTSGFVRLYTGETKSGEPRTIPLGEPGVELYDTLFERWLLREKAFPDCEWVFFRSSGPSAGEAIRQMSYTWHEAMKKTGVKKLFHDLRRTGARNLIRANVPEHLAMRITGHKTTSVFRRYDIVTEADLKGAAAKLNAYVAGGKK